MVLRKLFWASLSMSRLCRGKVADRFAFTGMVEGAECNIASTPGNVDPASDLADFGTSGLSEATNASFQRR